MAFPPPLAGIRDPPKGALLPPPPLGTLRSGGRGSLRRAAPELARMAERFAGTDAGRWAAAELRTLKEEMGREEGSPLP